MTGLKKIDLEEVKQIAEEYDLKPCKLKDGKGVQIRKKENETLEDTTWEEFEQILNERGLAVYKSESDWLKIMKDD